MRRSDALLFLAAKTFETITPEEERIMYDSLATLGELVMAATTHSDEFELAETLTLIAKDNAEAMDRKEAEQLKFVNLIRGQRK